MADADTSSYVQVREEDGRLYIGGDSNHAYVEELVWSMFIDVRNLRYVESYDYKENYRLKRSIRGKMSCDKDELGILGAPSVRLRCGETADIELCPTLDFWVTREGYDWTLSIPGTTSSSALWRCLTTCSTGWPGRLWLAGSPASA
jgi:hypothetical protein